MLISLVRFCPSPVTKPFYFRLFISARSPPPSLLSSFVLLPLLRCLLVVFFVAPNTAPPGVPAPRPRRRKKNVSRILNGLARGHHLHPSAAIFLTHSQPLVHRPRRPSSTSPPLPYLALTQRLPRLTNRSTHLYSIPISAPKRWAVSRPCRSPAQSILLQPRTRLHSISSRRP